MNIDDVLNLKKIFEQDEEEQVPTDPFQPASREEIEARLTPEQIEYRRQQEERKRQQEERERVRAEQKAAVYQRLERIAARLGFDGTPIRDESYYRGPRVQVPREDGGRIILNVYKWQPIPEGGTDTNKVTVGLDYVPDAEDVEGDPDFRERYVKFQHSEKPTPINISLKKSDDRIISDIKRRIIGQLDPAIERAKGRIASDLDRRRAMAQAQQAAIAAFGTRDRTQGKVNSWRDVISEYYDGPLQSISYKVMDDGKTSSINLRINNSIGPEILTFLKKFTESDKEEDEDE